jgi:hypothetical protein
MRDRYLLPSLIVVLSIVAISILLIFPGFITMESINSATHTNNLSDLETSPQNASFVVMGATYIQVPEGAMVVTQVNRVIKDSESNINTNMPDDHRPQSPSELVPYMEGARVKELMKYSDVKLIPATNVTVKYTRGGWWGPDDQGNYVFGVDPSKVMPIFAKEIDNNTRLVLETHGMNLMVPEAVKDHAFLVVACGDLPGKAQAEAYMNTKGINCYAPCDRFTPMLLNKTGPGISLGSEPIRPQNYGTGAIIGAQPVAINLKEKIIVQTTTKRYPDQYCDTPNRYFTDLEQVYGINMNLDVVDASVGESSKVVDEAHKTGANVIAVRVLNQQDRQPVEQWLKEDKNHRAILFHSAAYEPGYSLFFEFPQQVTGQDPRPVFIKQTPETEIQKIFNQIRSLAQNIQYNPSQWGNTQPPNPSETPLLPNRLQLS